MRKILLATPLKGGLDEHYFEKFFEVISKGVPDCKFGFCFISNTAINLARNEIGMYVLLHGYDEVIFWDKDLRPTHKDFIRLLSHPEDVVCGLYALRRKDTAWNLQAIPDTEPDPKTGLLKVHQSAIGFSKIKKEAFEKLVDVFPERSCIARDNGRDGKLMHEFFPMGIIGPNSNEGRLEAIKAWLKNPAVHNLSSVQDFIDGLEDVLYKRHSEPSFIVGEDYFFCKLCRDAGIDLYVDTHLIIPHVGDCEFPIPTHELEAMLKEPWRIAEKEQQAQAELAAAAN